MANPGQSRLAKMTNLKKKDPGKTLPSVPDDGCAIKQTNMRQKM